MSETKLDESSSIKQFQNRRDRETKYGVVFCFLLARKYHPNQVHLKMITALNTFSQELIQEKKWLLSCSYHRHTDMIEKHLSYLQVWITFQECIRTAFYQVILTLKFQTIILTLFRMDFSGTAHGSEAGPFCPPSLKSL